MSSYTVSKSLNPKRVFILQKSELEKRFDPFFYGIVGNSRFEIV